MNLAIIYGTRPEFLKLKVLIDTFRKDSKILLKVIKVKQHIHLTEDEGYYTDVLELDNLCEDRLSNIGANILVKLPSYIINCTHILAQGDTATVFYALLCGFQMKKKCIHLEAGMRTYNLENPYPEEGYRQMISRITDIHFCPSENEKQILLQEKVNGQIHIVGNTILDLVKSYNIPITNSNKILITLHRRENWDTFRNYIIELSKLASKNIFHTFYFLTHPNPSLQLVLEDLKENIPPNFNVINALPHKELIELLSECSCVITDSGGIQEEANYLGKHIYVLRKVTERNAIQKEKITFCSLETIKDIDCSIENHEQGYEYGDGSSSSIILSYI